MSVWDGNQLERLMGARELESGRVPLMNPRDAQTQAEIDIYSLAFGPESVSKAVVECTTSSLDEQNVLASQKRAEIYGAVSATMAVTKGVHRDVQAMAGQAGTGIERIPDLDAAVRNLSDAGRSVFSVLCCLAELIRTAEGVRDRSQLAIDVKKTYNGIAGSILQANPFERAEILYQAHFAHPALSMDCAEEEQLGGAPTSYESREEYRRECLRKAFVEGCGTYTQTALMVQTLNRLYTLVTLAECAVSPVERAASEIVHSTPRWLALVDWLSEQPLRQHLAPFFCHLLFVLGGFLPEIAKQEIHNEAAARLGCPPADIAKLIALADDLFRRYDPQAGVGRSFIACLEYYGFKWESWKLLPYFLKGIGSRHIRNELGLDMTRRASDPLARRAVLQWEKAADRLEAECETWEKSH